MKFNNNITLWNTQYMPDPIFLIGITWAHDGILSACDCFIYPQSLSSPVSWLRLGLED